MHSETETCAKCVLDLIGEEMDWDDDSKTLIAHDFIDQLPGGIDALHRYVLDRAKNELEWRAAYHGPDEADDDSREALASLSTRSSLSCSSRWG